MIVVWSVFAVILFVSAAATVLLDMERLRKTRWLRNSVSFFLGVLPTWFGETYTPVIGMAAGVVFGFIVSAVRKKTLNAVR